jgi:cell division protein FtsQ
MTYSRGARSGQRRTSLKKKRKVGPALLIWGMFTAIFRLAGLSLLLALSLGFIVLISIALLYGYNTAMNSDFFRLKTIEISGNRHLTYDQLTRLMEVGPGDSVLQLKVSDLHAGLLRNPWIEQVSVKRVFPDRLVVNLKEKQAYFWIRDGEELFYGDEKGRIITRVSPGRFVSLPVLHIEDQQEGQDLESIVDFLENRNFPFSLQDVSWIRAGSSGLLEIRLAGDGPGIVLEMELLDFGPGRLRSLWSDLGARQERELVENIMIMGDNAWVEYRQALN